MGNSEIEAVKSKTSDQKDLDLEAALCCFIDIEKIISK